MAEEQRTGDQQKTGALTTVNKATRSLSKTLADRFGTDPAHLIEALKMVAFKNASITTPQLVGLMIVADQYKLNPFTRELHAYPDKQGGIVPIVGVDGWTRIMNENPQYDGIEFRESENIIQIDEYAKNCPEWIESVIYRKDRNHPVVVREYLDESYRKRIEVKKPNQAPYFVNTPWQTHTKRMLRNKAIIQGARVAFGYSGIYDADEGRDVVKAREAEFEIVNGPDVVTPEAPEKQPPAPAAAAAAGVREPENLQQPPAQPPKQSRRKRSGKKQQAPAAAPAEAPDPAPAAAPAAGESAPPPLAEPGKAAKELDQLDLF